MKINNLNNQIVSQSAIKNTTDMIHQFKIQ